MMSFHQPLIIIIFIPLLIMFFIAIFPLQRNHSIPNISTNLMHAHKLNKLSLNFFIQNLRLLLINNNNSLKLFRWKLQISFLFYLIIKLYHFDFIVPIQFFLIHNLSFLILIWEDIASNFILSFQSINWICIYYLKPRNSILHLITSFIRNLRGVLIA